MKQRRSCRGFSLLEVVVAFAIASIALVVLSQVFGLGTRNLTVSREYAQAVSLSDALLARYGRALHPGPRVISGTTAAYRWQVTVEAYNDDAGLETQARRTQAATPDKQLTGLARIRVDVDWRRHGKTRTLSVASLGLMSQEPDETL